MGKCPQQQESTKSGGSQTLNEYNKPKKVGTEDVFSFYFPGFHLFGFFFSEDCSAGSSLPLAAGGGCRGDL